MFVSVATNQGYIGIIVKHGNRPPLDAITGPADLLSFAKKWIARCWHKSPHERPSFAGKLSPCVVEANNFVYMYLNSIYCKITA